MEEVLVGTSEMVIKRLKSQTSGLKGGGTPYREMRTRGLKALDKELGREGKSP